MNKSIKAENWVQVEAIRRINGDVLEIIKDYASDFRQIICEFELMHEGEVPSADDLIWLISERKGCDVTDNHAA